MSPTPRVDVVGLEADGTIPSEAESTFSEADMILGWPRHLEQFDNRSVPLMELQGIGNLIPILRSFPDHYSLILLSTGDPLDHGIGEYLAERYPAHRLSIIPARSSIQLALARLRQSRRNTFVQSLHGRPLDKLRHALARQPETIVLFTDHRNPPRRIFQFLDSIDCRDYGFHLFENLGRDNERHTTANQINQLPDHPDPLNLVVLTRNQSNRRKSFPQPGIPDSELTGTDDSMITPFHQRMMNLGHLDLSGNETVWDIGAATGSISIELARLHPDLTVHAIEKAPDRIKILNNNIKKFHTYNVFPHNGEAPEIFTALPDPDRVFIGGSGGRPEEIISALADRLNPDGRILANFITFENANRSRQSLLDHGFDVDERLVTVHHQGTIAQKYRKWNRAGALHQLIATRNS